MNELTIQMSLHLHAETIAQLCEKSNNGIWVKRAEGPMNKGNSEPERSGWKKTHHIKMWFWWYGAGCTK